MTTYVAAAVPSTTAPRARSYDSPATVPAHALTYFRRLVRGERYASGAELVRVLFCRCARSRGRRLDPIEAERVVYAARALWHEGTPSPLGGRAF